MLRPIGLNDVEEILKIVEEKKDRISLVIHTRSGCPRVWLVNIDDRDVDTHLQGTLINNRFIIDTTSSGISISRRYVSP